jgi:hypothetical protein
VNRSLVTMLILGIVNLAVPATAWARAAGDENDETSRTEVTAKTPLLAPGVLQRSIAVAAHNAALQAPQTGTDKGSSSHKACVASWILMGGAGVAFATAWAKHRSWADSGATKTAGAKPPSSVGWSVTIGAVLAGAGIFTMSKTCGQ